MQRRTYRLLQQLEICLTRFISFLSLCCIVIGGGGVGQGLDSISGLKAHGKIFKGKCSGVS